MNITDNQKEQISQVARKNDVKSIILFGSQVKGHTHPQSDIDIAVLSNNKPNYTLYSTLYEGFSNILGDRVDVRFLNDADPQFGMQVLSSGVLLYGDPTYFNLLKTQFNRRYIDDGKKYFPYLHQLATS